MIFYLLLFLVGIIALILIVPVVASIMEYRRAKFLQDPRIGDVRLPSVFDTEWIRQPILHRYQSKDFEFSAFDDMIWTRDSRPVGESRIYCDAVRKIVEEREGVTNAYHGRRQRCPSGTWL